MCGYARLVREGPAAGGNRGNELSSRTLRARGKAGLAAGRQLLCGKRADAGLVANQDELPTMKNKSCASAVREELCG
jgi:hypothetical protein